MKAISVVKLDDRVAVNSDYTYDETIALLVCGIYAILSACEIKPEDQRPCIEKMLDISAITDTRRHLRVIKGDL